MSEKQKHGSVSQAIDNGVNFAGKMFECFLYFVGVLLVASFILKALGLG